MDINSYETLKVVETMREYGAPYSALSVATGLPESKLKAYRKLQVQVGHPVVDSAPS